jgi:hypothetical protein
MSDTNGLTNTEAVYFGVTETADGWCPKVRVVAKDMPDTQVVFIFKACDSREDAELWCMVHGEQFATFAGGELVHNSVPLNDGTN